MEKKINRKIFQKYFVPEIPSQFSKALYNMNDKKENNVLVNVTRNALRANWNNEWSCKKSEEPDQIV